MLKSLLQNYKLNTFYTVVNLYRQDMVEQIVSSFDFLRNGVAFCPLLL